MLEIIGLIFFFVLSIFFFVLWQRSEREKVKLKIGLSEASIYKQVQEQMGQTFKNLSQEALVESGKTFLQLAAVKMEKYEEAAKGQARLQERSLTELFIPLKDSLHKFESHVKEIEKERLSSYSTLVEQLKGLSSTQLNLEKETKNLVKALRTPHVRGLWGEIQLKKVVEMAGMIEYCDFVQQEMIQGGESQRLRPDMIVRLPGERSLIIDAKTPLSAYLEAIESEDEGSKLMKLKDHARHLRNHINQLSTKSYYSTLKLTPEFVILFIPGEPLFSAALEQDPTLIEYSTQQNVILATPITLIAVLRAIAHSWRQEQVAKNTTQITELGKLLHERILLFTQHFQEIKKGLEKATESYNKTLTSLETRVLVSARKLKDLAAPQQEEIPTLTLIDSREEVLKE